MAVNKVIVEKKCYNTYAHIEEYQCTYICQIWRGTTYQVGSAICSPIFYTGDNNKHQWAVKVYFGGFDSDSKDYVDILIYRDRKNRLVSFNKRIAPDVTIKLSILDKNNKQYEKQTRDLVDKLLFKNFVKRDYLLRSPDLLPNDELKLMCQISHDDASNQVTDIVSMATFTPWPTLRCRNALMSNLEKIFDSPEFSDFQVVVGDTRIKVHKCILAAHSSVFAAMFQNDMLEKNKSQVEIEDADAIVMRQLLRFIYIGKVEDIDDYVDKLFAAAHKYELDELKEVCEEKLIEKLCVDNLYETLIFIDRYDTTILEGAAIDFIIQNSKKLSTMEEFKKLIKTLSSTLLAKVICALMAKSE